MTMVEYLFTLAQATGDVRLIACGKMLHKLSKDHDDLRNRYAQLNALTQDLIKPESRMPCPPCKIGDILYSADPNLPGKVAAHKVIKIMYTLTEQGSEKYIQTTFVNLDGATFGLHTHDFLAVGVYLFPTAKEALRMDNYVKENSHAKNISRTSPD